MNVRRDSDSSADKRKENENQSKDNYQHLDATLSVHKFNQYLNSTSKLRRKTSTGKSDFQPIFFKL